MKPSPIPAGYHSLQAYIIVTDPLAAMDFYKRLFGATELMRLEVPETKQIMHAELKIGDSVLMLAGEWPDYGVFSPVK